MLLSDCHLKARTTNSMSSAEVTAAKMALIRKLVTKEAERRQQQQLNQHSNGIIDSRRHEDSIDVGPSSVTIEDVQVSEEENRQLRDMLNEERTRNDVEWEAVRQVRFLWKIK